MEMKDAKIGMFVTAYEKGYHILTSVYGVNSKYPDTSVAYERVLNSTGKVSRSGPKQCHVLYVEEVTKADVEKLYQKKLQEAQILRDSMLKFCTR